jgi:hypothetical protein
MGRDYRGARDLYEESIALNRGLGEERMVAGELRNLGYVELNDGHTDRARELFGTSRAEAERLGFEGLKPYIVGDAAALAAEKGDTEGAAVLAGAAEAAFATSGTIPDPDDAAERRQLSDRLSRALGPEGAAAGYAAGRRLSVAQALERAER